MYGFGSFEVMQEWIFLSFVLSLVTKGGDLPSLDIIHINVSIPFRAVAREDNSGRLPAVWSNSLSADEMPDFRSGVPGI